MSSNSSTMSCTDHVAQRTTSGICFAFRSFKIGRFASQHKLDWVYSFTYNAKANGLIENFKKTLSKLIKKIVAKREGLTS